MGTVLVVDDDPMVRDVATAILQRLSLTVVAAPGGAEAVELMKDGPDRFDLALLDLTMPDMSGSETLLAIHEVRPDMPVIIMSGYNEAEASGRFPADEPAGFLEKPFSTKGLSAAVEAVLGTSASSEPPGGTTPGA
jgi:DNA-binding NtrC family response regulator